MSFNIPLQKNFVCIRTGKNRLSETAAVPKVGVETIGRMPSVGSCESWRVSVPGGSRISSVDPLGLSFAILHFPVADRSGPVPSVILQGLTISLAWAVQKSCAGSRIKCMQNVYSLKLGITMVLHAFRNSGGLLGLNVACTMLLVPKCICHYQHFILYSWLS